MGKLFRKSSKFRALAQPIISLPKQIFGAVRRTVGGAGDHETARSVAVSGPDRGDVASRQLDGLPDVGRRHDAAVGPLSRASAAVFPAVASISADSRASDTGRRAGGAWDRGCGWPQCPRLPGTGPSAWYRTVNQGMEETPASPAKAGPLAFCFFGGLRGICATAVPAVEQTRTWRPPSHGSQSRGTHASTGTRGPTSGFHNQARQCASMAYA